MGSLLNMGFTDPDGGSHELIWVKPGVPVEQGVKGADLDDGGDGLAQSARTAWSTGVSPATRLNALPIALSAISTSASTAATSSRGISARWDLRAGVDQPGALVVGQQARPDDGEIEAAVPQTPVGLRLGVVVRPHLLRRVLRMVRVDRADHHVALHPRVHQLHRGAEVNRLLALGPAPGTGAGGEHHGVRALDRGRESRPRPPCRGRSPAHPPARGPARGRGCARCRGRGSRGRPTAAAD